MKFSLNGNNVPCSGKQGGSHHDKFKFVAGVKCTVFMLGDSVANTVIEYRRIGG